jgi:5-methylcytosine-specific restriction endonuclease McrA
MSGKKKLIDLIGTKFGKLTVLTRVEDKKYPAGGSAAMWLCICECGNKKNIIGADLRKKATLSCGCIKNNSNFSFNMLWHDYRFNAKTRNRTFDLSKETFRTLTSENCFYCGDKPFRERRAKAHGKIAPPYAYNGIDRIDSSKGYTLENCRPCCYSCNIAKSDMTEENFLNHIKKIYKHLVLEGVS